MSRLYRLPNELIRNIGREDCLDAHDLANFIQCDGLEVFDLLLTPSLRNLLSSEKHQTTPLCFAVRNKYHKLAGILLSSGEDINERAFVSGHRMPYYPGDHQYSTYGIIPDSSFERAMQPLHHLTAIHCAAQTGDIDMVKLLLSNGADLSIRPTDNSTALHAAIVSPAYDEVTAEIVALLLDSGADISAVNESGQTPLHWASLVGKKETAMLLLMRGAVCSEVDSLGRTALHLAVECEQLVLIEMLMYCEESCLLVDEYGMTALDIARDGVKYTGRDECLKALLGKLSDPYLEK